MIKGAPLPAGVLRLQATRGACGLRAVPARRAAAYAGKGGVGSGPADRGKDALAVWAWIYDLALPSDVFRADGQVRLDSRNGKDFTLVFPEIASALAEALAGRRVTGDGEIIAQNPVTGASDYGQLRHRFGTHSSPELLARVQVSVPLPDGFRIYWQILGVTPVICAYSRESETCGLALLAGSAPETARQDVPITGLADFFTLNRRRGGRSQPEERHPRGRGDAVRAAPSCQPVTQDTSSESDLIPSCGTPVKSVESACPRGSTPVTPRALMWSRSSIRVSSGATPTCDTP